jgi:hypothetical protein
MFDSHQVKTLKALIVHCHKQNDAGVQYDALANFSPDQHE